MFVTRQITPFDEENEEEWTRDIEPARDRDVHGVGVTKARTGAWRWRVFVCVMEFVRGIPSKSSFANASWWHCAGFEA